MAENLAILGGTFDPVHIAHLRMALEAAEVAGLDRVIFMPCAQNPFDKTIRASAEHRLEMLRLATSGHPSFEVSDLEARLGGKSYTVNTLAKVHELYPEARIHFLIGADAFFHLHTWHQPMKLFDLADFIVMARPKSPTWDVLEYMRDALDNRFRETGDGWVRLGRRLRGEKGAHHLAFHLQHRHPPQGRHGAFPGLPCARSGGGLY